jgi:hypothetical protein
MCRMGNLDFSAINNAHAFRKPIDLEASALEQLHFLVEWKLDFIFQLFCRSDSYLLKEPGQHLWADFKDK